MNREIEKKQYFYPEVKKIVSDSLEANEGRVILIVGNPGSGKSVFMSQLYDEFEKQGLEYLTAIRAEFLNETNSPEDVYELFMRVKDVDKPKILLLDSLDVLAYSRRRELLDWLFYVDKLKDMNRMTVICASRSFEAEHLYPMNEQNWSEKIPIPLLPDDFINKVLKKVGYNYNSLSTEFLEFLKIPLHLKITVEIIKNGGDPKSISDLHGLYAKLFEVLNISPEEMNLLIQLAELMLKNRTVFLPYPSINILLLDAVKKLKNRPGITGLIQIDSKKQRISFSHQTLIDYLAALKVILEDKSIADFVLEHKQSLFIRPVLRHILEFLRLSSQTRLFKELEEIFLGKIPVKKIGFKQKGISIRFHVKTAILANMASWKKPTDMEGRFLNRVFKEAEDRQELIVQFFSHKPNSKWYDVLKDIYILPILKNSNELDIGWSVIISFLANIARDKPAEVLDICTFLLEGHKNSSVLKWFIRRVSDELSKKPLDEPIKEKYVDVLEKAVKKEVLKLPHDIATTCKRIASYFPERGLRLYFDCALKELKNVNSKVALSRRDLTKLFEEVLPSIYEKIPYKTLIYATDFFEQVITNKAEGEGKLPDSPDLLLYSEPYNTGLLGFYEWYRNRMLEFCSNLNEQTKEIISKLEKSKWETQRQLSMLCKLKNIEFYRDDVLGFVKNILKSNLKNPDMYEQSELFIKAIEEIFKVIEEKERNEIISAILNFDFEDRTQAREWIFKPLHHIPKEYWTEQIKEKIEEVRKRFNFEEKYRYIPSIGGSVTAKWAQPIIDADKLQAMSPEELYEFLIQNRNLKPRWDFKKDVYYGGVGELAHEAGKALAGNIGKYKEVVDKLAKQPIYDIYLRWFLAQVSQKGISEEHMDWFINLVSSVYKRENLQKEIIYALAKVSELINEKHFDMIKEILIEFSNAKDPAEDKFIEIRSKGYANDALNDGINSTRGALVELIVPLTYKFKDSILLEILEKLSKDETISVRAVVVAYLPQAINSIGWAKCFELFSNAFEKGGAEEYAKYIWYFLSYVPNNKFGEIKWVLDEMKNKREGRLGVPYALLMGIYYLRGLVSEEEIINIFKDNELMEEGKKKCFELLANQVKFEENVDKCLKVINTLLEKDILKGRLSILFIHARPEDFKKFVPVINKIIERPKVRGEVLYYILEYLEKSIISNPLGVFKCLETLLSNVGNDFYNLRDYIPASHSKAPLNIINTILECYPEEENRALDALDKLIELNWYGVDEYLHGLDRL